MQNDMCAGLTPDQLKPYTGAVRKQEPGKDPGGIPICSWLPDDGHLAGVTLFADANADDVADLYQRRLGDNFFEQVPPLRGYPAVHVSQLAEGPARGDCMTIVSVADRARVSVVASTVGRDFQYYTSMCTVTDKLAEAAIENLKARG